MATCGVNLVDAVFLSNLFKHFSTFHSMMEVICTRTGKTEHLSDSEVSVSVSYTLLSSVPLVGSPGVVQEPNAWAWWSGLLLGSNVLMEGFILD